MAASRRRFAVRTLLFVLAVAGAARAETGHPNSLSQLELQVTGTELLLRLRVQGRTLLEAESLALDADRDGLLSREELQRAWPRVAAYIEGGLRLTVDGTPWTPRFASFEFEPLPDYLDEQPPRFFARLAVAARRPLGGHPDRLEARSSLFFGDGNPDHRMSVTVSGLTPEPEHALLSAQQPGCAFPLPVAGRRYRVEQPLLDYLKLGWDHVLAGADHLAFLLALLLGVHGLGSLLGAVTAFTLAHSLTLGLAALGWVRLAPEVVEPAIALSIVTVVWLHLALERHRARPWIPALVFGLVHGFGFAGVLGEIGLPSDDRLTALLGFNLGVEAGQLSFVLPIVGLAALGLRARREGWPPSLRLLAGSAIAALGAYFTARTVTDAWLTGLLAGRAEEVRLLPVALLLYAGILLILRRRRTPEGEPLAPVVALSALLLGVYLAGRLLGS